MSGRWKPRLAFLAGLALTVLGRTADAATITVTTAVDDISPNNGSVSLREAIMAVNAGNDLGDPDITAQLPGTFGLNDTIAFGIAGSGVHTIDVGTDPSAMTVALPKVTKPVVIDGYTQSGASPNTLAVGNNAVLLIEINGTGAGAIIGGVLEVTGGNSTVRGLVLNRAQGGNSVALRLSNGGNNTVTGNFIGIDPSGLTSRSNGCQGLGLNSSSNNVIGGLDPADRNVISSTGGCGGNVVVGNGSSNNQFLNNYLGTDAPGTAGLGSSAGILIIDGNAMTGSFGNTIGGTTAAARNVIAANSTGILLNGVGAYNNVIQGNYIGLNAAGTAALPNSYGVRINSNAHDNTVGGTNAGAGNRIAFSYDRGVRVDSDAGNHNAIVGNSIVSSGSIGIDLQGGTEDANFVTANDANDPDSGPNGLQNHPVLTSATSDGVTVTINGTFNSTPSTSFRFEFFSNAACDPSGFGEGEIFLGSVTQMTDASGDVTISAPVAAPPSGYAITSTATDSNNNTSELSNCIAITGTPGPSFTPTGTATPTDIPGAPTSTRTITPTRTPTSATSTPTFTATSTPSLTPTSTPTGTPTRTPTAVTPGPAAFDLIPAAGLISGQACLAVNLTSHTQSVATATIQLTLDASQFPSLTCTINPDIDTGTPSNKQLVVMSPMKGTWSISIVGSNAVIPDGTLFACNVTIDSLAVLGSYAIANSTEARDPNGGVLPVSNSGTTIKVGSCSGDCDGSGSVLIGEVIKSLNLFGGLPMCNPNAPSLSCPMADSNHDAQVTIGEVVQSLNHFASSCPP